MGKQGRRPASGKPGNRGNKHLLWFGIATGLVLAVGMIALSLSGPRQSGAGSASVSNDASGTERTAKGDPNAPVIITMYSDFQCPYCAQAAEMLKQVEKDYIAKGKVYLIYRHFAFIGKESVEAAEAAECAADQGKFWAYHDKLFANQAGENKGAFRPERLKKFAQDLKLDMKAFNACFDSHKYRNQIEAEREQAKGIGVQTTPTFLVNGQMVLGAYPYQQFRQIIEDQLARAQ